MARPYRLGKRALGVAATRRRIMDATRELIERGGLEQANIQAIAKLACVTRPTVYQQFGTLQELLLAVTNEALDNADVRSVRKALQAPDAGKAVRGMLRASCKFWDSEFTLFSRIKGLALIDDDARHVDETKEKVRRGHIENIVGRLADQALLKPGLGRREAVDRLYLLSSFEAFERLRSAGNSVDTIAARLTDLADEAVLA